MTKQKDLKKKIRARAAKTGESYTEARRNILAATPGPSKEWLQSRAAEEDAAGIDMPPIGRGPRTVQHLHLDVGNLPPEKVEGFIEGVRQSYAKCRYCRGEGLSPCTCETPELQPPQLHTLQPHQLRSLMDLNAMDLTGLGVDTYMRFNDPVTRERQALCLSRLQSDRRSLDEIHEEAKWDPSRPRPYTNPPPVPYGSYGVVPVSESVLTELVTAPCWQRCPKCDEAAHEGVCQNYKKPLVVGDTTHEGVWDVPAKLNGMYIMLPLKVTYELLVRQAGMSGLPSMTYHWQQGNEAQGGILHWGDSITVKPDMVFNVTHTSEA